MSIDRDAPGSASGSADPAQRPPSAGGAAGASGGAAEVPGGERRFRVLVVDDEPINREVVAAMLETIGVFTEHAGDGSEAVEHAAGQRYDTIFMDLQMPSMGGLEATRLIRLQPANRRVPIVALTGDATAETRRMCIAAGMDGVVVKPFSLGTLLAVAESALAASGRGEAER